MLYAPLGPGREGGNILFLPIRLGVLEGIKSPVAIAHDLDVFIGSGRRYRIAVNTLVMAIHPFVDVGRCDGIKSLIGVA